MRDIPANAADNAEVPAALGAPLELSAADATRALGRAFTRLNAALVTPETRPCERCSLDAVFMDQMPVSGLAVYQCPNKHLVFVTQPVPT